MRMVGVLAHVEKEKAQWKLEWVWKRGVPSKQAGGTPEGNRICCPLIWPTQAETQNLVSMVRLIPHSSHTFFRSCTSKNQHTLGCQPNIGFSTATLHTTNCKWHCKFQIWIAPSFPIDEIDETLKCDDKIELFGLSLFSGFPVPTSSVSEVILLGTRFS